MDILQLIVGLLLILGGANYLTDGAAALAGRFRIPGFIVGLTVIAVGTSTPELVVSVLSALAGNSDVAVGNVVGSNLFNGLVIVGACALLSPLALSSGNIRRDIPYGLAAALLLFVLLSDKLLHIGSVDRIDRMEGIGMLLLYILMIGYTIRASRRSGDTAEPEDLPGRMSGWLMALMIVGGLAALVGGGELFLNGATAIARRLGVSDTVIAITLVAGGTSIPELASSIFSVVKGRSDMALGNVLGSNIANILLILGLSAAIRPLTPGGITTLDLAMVVGSAAALFLCAFTFRKRMIDRWEGTIFLAAYAGYVWYLIAR